MGFGYVDLSQRKNPENERKNIGINTIGLMEPPFREAMISKFL